MKTKTPAVDDRTRLQFAGLYVLQLLQTEGGDAPASLAEGEALLAPVLHWLVDQGYATVDSKDALQKTSQGSRVLAEFERRYESFLRDYDVFCAVDLETGEFALSFYDDYPGAAQWHAFLDQERWDDLRLAVAEHEGLDPVELLFMSFLKDERYGRDEEGWDFDRLLGSVWDELSAIVGSALTVADLGYDDGEEHVEGAAVIKDVIREGRALARELQG